jgi:hypothetical protein
MNEVRHDPEALAKREESDFLAHRNHEGKSFDFHCLRYTCGAWLALQGVHVSVIQSVMRHSTITLTIDTYGDLLPDQQFPVPALCFWSGAAGGLKYSSYQLVTVLFR